MKTINATKPINIDELYQYLTENLNKFFTEQRQTDLTLDVIKQGETIRIEQPQVYEGFLFKLTAEQPNQLKVEKSEHYVDDVNALTLESILDGIFVKILGATAPQI